MTVTTRRFMQSSSVRSVEELAAGPFGAADGECTCHAAGRFRRSVNPPMGRSGFGLPQRRLPLSSGLSRRSGVSTPVPGEQRMSEPHSPTPAGSSVVRVWDLPTRLFHWLLALAVVAQVITGKIGGAAMVWHFRIGYCIFALIVFRIVWGLVGGHWSRFASFVYGPASVWRYLRGAPSSNDHFHVGHNPLGSASVFAMLALLAVQVAS